jgi:hypothetical protein
LDSELVDNAAWSAGALVILDSSSPPPPEGDCVGLADAQSPIARVVSFRRTGKRRGASQQGSQSQCGCTRPTLRSEFALRPALTWAAIEADSKHQLSKWIFSKRAEPSPSKQA